MNPLVYETNGLETSKCPDICCQPLTHQGEKPHFLFIMHQFCIRVIQSYRARQRRTTENSRPSMYLDAKN